MNPQRITLLTTPEGVSAIAIVPKGDVDVKCTSAPCPNEQEALGTLILDSPRLFNVEIVRATAREGLEPTP